MPLLFSHRTLVKVSHPEQNRTQGLGQTCVLAAPHLTPNLAPTGSSTAQGECVQGHYRVMLGSGARTEEGPPEETKLDTPSPRGQGWLEGRTWDLGEPK